MPRLGFFALKNHSYREDAKRIKEYEIPPAFHTASLRT